MNTEASSQPVGSQPNVPPMPTATPVSRTWEVLSHIVAFSGFLIPFGNIIGPLVIWLMKKAESPSIEAHAKESLNFQISMTIWTLICAATFLILIGIVLVPAAIVTNVVLTIIGAVKASNGEFYRYPLTIRFIK